MGPQGLACGTENSVKKIASDLAQLQTSYADLMLIHFPKCYGAGSIAETHFM